MRGIIRPAAWAGIALLILALAGQAAGQPTQDKPPVPPGRDPGGVAVAIIGNGIDYTQRLIADNLARDGEGELIGWDFIDNDRRPFKACAQDGASAFCAADFVGVIPMMREARVVVMRAGLERPQSLVAAMQAIAQTPARIVLIATDTAPPVDFLADAARRFPDLLLFGAVDGKAFTAGEGWSRGVSYLALPVRQDVDDAHPRATAAAVAATVAAARCARPNASLGPAAVLDCTMRQLGLDGAKQ